MPESRGRELSYDALMRWEWEGGTPSSGGEPACTTGAENTDTLRLTNRRRRARQVASVSTLPSDVSQGDVRNR